ncbi:MAG: hypothetical protein K0V04_12285 [Deltaproteobacteria bacterium]|nr:hypothetical protein [Deltaproteobacteria bacterium]
MMVELLPPGPELLWLRRVHDVVALDATRMVVMGTHGDFFPEGLFLMAFEEDGTLAWFSLAEMNDAVPVRLEPRPSGGVWATASSYNGQTAVWRVDGDGTVSAPTLVEGLFTVDALALPDGGIWLRGSASASDSAPAYAQVDAAGALLWQGGQDSLAVEHVIADGTIQRFDAAGAQLWEHDPRPEPFAGFPLDRGAAWARLTVQGNTAAFGSIVDQGGDAALMLGLDVQGDALWSQLRPQVSVSSARTLDGERMLVVGRASQCAYQAWFGLYDQSGASLVEGRLADTTVRGTLGIDGADRPVSVDSTGNAVVVQWYPEVGP